MDSITLLGFLAATLTTLAFLPQLLKIYNSKSAKDISLPSFSVFSLGVLLWLIYGILKSDIPIIIANIVTIMIAIAIVFLKFRYERKG